MVVFTCTDEIAVSEFEYKNEKCAKLIYEQIIVDAALRNIVIGRLNQFCVGVALMVVYESALKTRTRNEQITACRYLRTKPTRKIDR